MKLSIVKSWLYAYVKLTRMNREEMEVERVPADRSRNRETVPRSMG